jgi:hypothetical protein
MAWVLSGVEAENHYYDAQYGHLLVCGPLRNLFAAISFY